MKPLLGLISTLLLLNSASVLASDAALGQRLFSQSRCLECHGAEVFTSPTRKVQNLQQLEQKVRQCDASLSTNWFDDEILAVVQYLNQTYYKFPTPAAAASPTHTPQVTTTLTSNPPHSLNSFFAR